MFNRVFQFLVLAQPVWWGYIYSSPLEFPDQGQGDTFFYTLAGIGATWLIITGFKVGYYTNRLMLMYVFLVAVSYTMYRVKFTSMKAMSLAFLTIYLNSYFWELPMHMAEYASLSFYPAQLHQVWRLSPLMVITREFRGVKWRYINLGVVVSSLVFWMRWYHWVPSGFGVLLIYLNRLICAVLLTQTLLDADSSYDLV